MSERFAISLVTWKKLAVEVNKETVSVSTMVTENNISINITLRELQKKIRRKIMSHTNSTENYNLPQFNGTDIPDWLTDVNKGYSDIDAGMQANKVLASTVNEKADNNTTSIQLLNERVDRISNDSEESVTNISNLNQTVGLHTTHLNEIDTINSKQTADIIELQTTQTEQGQDISAIQINTDKIPGIEQNLNTLTSSITAAEAEIESMGNRIDSIEEDIPNFAQKYRLSSKYPQATPASGELFGVDRCVAKAVIDKDGATIGWYIDSLLLTNFTANKQVYAFNLTLPEDLLWDEYMGNGSAQLIGDISDTNLNSPVLLGIGVNRGTLPARTRTMVMFIPETWTGNADVKITQKQYF